MAETNCRAEKCKLPVRAKRYCDRHYRKWRRGELPDSRYKICKSESCRKPMIGKGYCQEHFDSWKASRKHLTLIAKAKPAEPVVEKPAEPVADSAATP